MGPATAGGGGQRRVAEAAEVTHIFTHTFTHTLPLELPLFGSQVGPFWRSSHPFLAPELPLFGARVTPCWPLSYPLGHNGDDACGSSRARGCHNGQDEKDGNGDEDVALVQSPCPGRVALGGVRGDKGGKGYTTTYLAS